MLREWISMEQYHLRISEGDIAPFVLLPGDPARVPVIAATWDSAEEVANNREYVTYTGIYKGVQISCTSTGIGAPSTSIAMEELARCGARTFLRVGTCGTFQDYVENGDMAIFDGAVRLDGASRAYAPLAFPAVAHHEVVQAAVAAARSLDFQHHVGITRTADTFYAGHPRPGSSYNNFFQSAWENQFDDFQKLNVLAAEMEASLIFVLARAWRLRAGGISVVMDNLRHVSGESGIFEPQRQLNHGSHHIERLALLANETIFSLHQHDQSFA
ncbi:nucleoside phosphorylase [Mycobacterium sp. CBMA271]|nr:nucleoside phosphorylase [Mycobacteroides sp. CBMA 271]